MYSRRTHNQYPILIDKFRNFLYKLDMTDYITALGNPTNPYHREAKTLVEKLKHEATITNGVIRWNSNGSVPPVECVALAVHVRLPIDLAECTRVRDEETREFFNEYRKRNRGFSSEERMEMRAEFGEGTTVINVITGRRVKV